ncbi:AraC-type DNA-binding protein [Paenibacillus sp. UNC496MF]|uniref:helix-turn-helix transcriptional regulator n=1 Tax=Paenibacillus sp. UNC496MF TaxID=1502753 RepID=UPI0008E4965E|nr:AraC family transcriptional regulator [Paenibacillus sp. UNC496MF]SFJ32141.1 AraC-type DNA-binding protein [Paenibacillus sp. UNC496MF]
MNEMPSLYTAIDNYPSGWKMGMHKHPHFEIAVVMLGSGAVYTEDRHYSIQQGDAILINPGVPHDFSSKTPIRIAVLQVDPLSLEHRQLFHQITNEESLCLLPLAYYALERYEKLFSIWIHISSLRATKLFHQFVRTWVQLFLLFLLECVENRDNRVTLGTISAYIRTNIDKEIRISELAKMMHVSESGLRASFKKTYGLSPKQYLQRYRMSEAKTMLKLSDKNIQQIAQQVGFPSIHAFSAWFQKETGASPSLWRKDHIASHED